MLRALRTLGIQYDAIVGTSIGSLIGAMVAGGTEIERLEELLAGLEREDYFRLNTAKILRRGYAPRACTKARRSSAASNASCRRTHSTSWTSVLLQLSLFGVRGEHLLRFPWAPDLSLTEAVYASCALPAVFEPSSGTAGT